jgi:cytoskeletal protein CcmA (bactofilin family)
MAVQNPFFGKRETESFQPRHSATSSTGLSSSTSATASTTPTAAINSAASPSASDSSGSKLTVGPNIKLKGVEITDCDTLVVEGTVEATMNSRVIQISHNGEFSGSLTVRQKLVIYSTGKVTGKIRYGKLVVEEGGQLAGEIESGFGNGATAPSSSAVQHRPASAPMRAEPTAMAA